MLKRLTVENYALISSLEMELSGGLNIITGETGAGKSILLGALGLLLGGRAESGVLGDATRNCIVEGAFDIAGYSLESFFEENDLDFDTDTVIRRVITPAGKSRAYVNDLPVSAGTLKELGSRLIDIHSQHQHLMIGNERYRLGIVDSVAAERQLMADYGTAYAAWRTGKRELDELCEAAAQSRRDEEYLRFQCEELTAAALKEGEQEELEERLTQLSHAEEICEALAAGGNALEEEEAGILPRLKGMENALSKVGSVYSAGSQLAERIHGVIEELKDIGRELELGQGSIDSDPETLEKTRARLDMLYALQQKHRAGDTAELIAIRDEYQRKLSSIDLDTRRIEELQQEVGRSEARVRELAAAITDARKAAAVSLKEETEAILRELGMPDALFDIVVENSGTPGPGGADTVQFLFSANGNTPRPADKIASGGEISRLMLALKATVASRTQLPTIIFDEIDTGVSGAIADRMGNIIRRMSADMQTVDITHLPQVASKGDTHFLVYKSDEGNGMHSSIRMLSANERVTEIAKMLSGSRITEAAMAQARLLLDSRN